MTPLVTPNHRIIAGRHSSDHQPPRGRCAAVSRASSCLAAELDRVGAVATGEAARSLLSLSRPALDFTALATGMGVPAFRATTAEELATHLRHALAEPGPHLIEAIIPGP